MFIQDAKMLKDLNLPLSCQVLISKENDTTLIDQSSELIKLLVSELTQLNVLQLGACAN